MRALLVFPVLALVGCSSDSEVGQSELVPTPVFLEVVECTPEGSYCPDGLQVKMRAGEYPCFNYQIVHDTSTSGTTLRATLLDVTKPELCLTAQGPAVGSIDLDPQDLPETLELMLGTRVDRYTLRRDADGLKLIKVRTSFSTAQPWKP